MWGSGLTCFRPTYANNKADNTVKEAKNNTCFKYLCWLQLQKSLDLTGAIMSRVGHTHSSLGFCVNSSSRNLYFMLFWCGLRVWLCQCLVCNMVGGKWWEDLFLWANLILRSNLWFAVKKYEIYARSGWWSGHCREPWSSWELHGNGLYVKGAKSCEML